MKLLVIEDEMSLQELICKTLKTEGYLAESAMNRACAIDRLGSYDYDVVLLDLMLPDGNGLDILKHIKDSSMQCAVIIISARDSIDDKVKGLEMGADDYLAKPFHLSELVARVRSVARRRWNSGELQWKVGNVVLEDVSRRLTIDGKDVTLLKKEYDILKYFLMRPGYTVDKVALAEAVWGDHVDQVDDFQFVYAQVKNLRRKLMDAGADVEIKSVYGFGYRLIGSSD